MRRHLGFKMRHEERRLRRFVSFMELHNASYITSKLALQWAMEPTDAQRPTWAERLMCVRVFARYCSGADPRTEVPPIGLIPYRPQRATPYLYSEEEIRGLMDAAQTLPPSGGLRGLTYRCLFGLLTVTGMRISEVLALTRDDVDLQNGLLTVSATKFGKSRLVPLHASACRALALYARERDALLKPPYAANFLLCASGRPPEVSTVRRVFYQLSRHTGLRGPSNRTGPRLQDFRHRCATEILLKWYQSGEDVERRLPVLSTFLGHGHISDTFWYLSGSSELLEQAAQRLEKRCEVRP
jgi:integrase